MYAILVDRLRGEQIISVESGELNLDKLGTGYQLMEIEKMVDSVMESSVIGQGLRVNGPLGPELYHAGFYSQDCHIVPGTASGPWCGRSYSPVCGSDRMTNSSQCSLNLYSCQVRLKLRVLHEGNCNSGGWE